MEYTNLQVTSRLPRIGKGIALVTLIIGVGGAAFLAFDAFDKNTQQAPAMEPAMDLLAMSTPMQSAQIKSFIPTIRAAGIAGVANGLSLRMPLPHPAASYNLRTPGTREMTTHAIAG